MDFLSSLSIKTPTLNTRQGQVFAILNYLNNVKLNNMVKKVVTKRDVKDFSSVKEDLAYWLSKTPEEQEEQVEAVEYLRRQLHGSSKRLQKTARNIQQA